MSSKSHDVITKTSATFSSLQNSFQIGNLWNHFFQKIEMQLKVALVTLNLKFNGKLLRLQ